MAANKLQKVFGQLKKADRAKVSFDCTTEDVVLIGVIAKRYEVLLRDAFAAEFKFDRQSCVMDLMATHANGCPLRLKCLSEADDFNLAHDVGGIARHLDRNTGKLMDCFLPRFAAPIAEDRPA